MPFLRSARHGIRGLIPYNFWIIDGPLSSRGRAGSDSRLVSLSLSLALSLALATDASIRVIALSVQSRPFSRGAGDHSFVIPESSTLY